MTPAATLPPRAAARSTLAAPPRRKPKVGLGDLVALTLRQHRFSLSLVVLLYVLYGLMVQLTNGRAALGDWRFDPKIFVPGLAVIAALFIGAPLLSSEYEQHTNLLVWSQDVPAIRWLLTKLALFGGTVAVLSVALNVIVHNQAVELFSLDEWSGSPMSPFGWIGFETWYPLVIAYALFGFLLGIAVGALTRRTVTAMGITLIGFAAVRFLVAGVLRPWMFTSMITPVEKSWPFVSAATPTGGAGHFDYDINPDVWLNSSGQQLPQPLSCFDGQGDDASFVHCVRAKGITHTADIFQPYSRLVIFQSVELAVYVVLIAVCLTIAIRSIRRRASI